jgi:AraC-like DNA-binding protein
VPPHEYLLRRRIEREQELLMTDHKPLLEIAWPVGFQAQSHFIKTFKLFVGQRPQAWLRCQIAWGRNREPSSAAKAADRHVGRRTGMSGAAHLFPIGRKAERSDDKRHAWRR